MAWYKCKCGDIIRYIVAPNKNVARSFFLTSLKTDGIRCYDSIECVEEV